MTRYRVVSVNGGVAEFAPDQDGGGWINVIDHLRAMITHQNSVAVDALIDFATYLTQREGTLVSGSAHETPLVMDVLQEYADKKGLNLNERKAV